MEASLSTLEIGETAKVKYIMGGMGFQSKILSLGIRIGKSIKVLSSQPFRGPIAIEVGGTKIALGRGMAEKIIIEK